MIKEKKNTLFKPNTVSCCKLNKGTGGGGGPKSEPRKRERGPNIQEGT